MTDYKIDHFLVVEEDGFEPSKSSTTDLQSAPFGHSGTPPYEIGAGGRTRTPDLLITNQLLYQLSYTSLFVLFVSLSTDVFYYIILKTVCQEFFKTFFNFFSRVFSRFCCAVTTDNILSQTLTLVNPFSTIFLIFLNYNDKTALQCGRLLNKPIKFTVYSTNDMV